MLNANALGFSGGCQYGAFVNTLNFFGDGNTITTKKFDGDVTDLNASYNGTPSGPITYEAGTFGQRVILNGATTWVVTTTRTNLDSSHMWSHVKISSPNTATGSIQTVYNNMMRNGGASDPNNSGWRIGFYSDGKIMFHYNVLNNETYTSNIWSGGRTSYAIQIGTSWAATNDQEYDVTIWFNGNTAKIWVDGVLEDSITTTQSIRYSSATYNSISHGVLYYPDVVTYNQLFAGTIDQHRVGINRTITDADVQDLINECRS